VEEAPTVEDKCIQTLMKLGLTFLQAKTYNTLSKIGTSTIKTISKASGIARQDIYRVMQSLQKLGVAEKIVTAPTMYKAIPLKEGLFILLQNKTREYTELQKETTELLNNFHESSDETVFQDEEQQFSIISSETLLFKKLAERENTTQTSIAIVGEWEGIKTALFYRLQDFKKAMKRGVKIRIIVEKQKDNNSIQKITQTLKTNPLFGIRYISAPIPVKTVIHDGTEVNMCIAISPDSNVPSLWSNNPQFVKIMVTHFEELWNKAVDAAETLPRKNAKLKTSHMQQSQPKVQPTYREKVATSHT
jgi:sugar-specific transcriptional regulator TrmB